MRHPSLERGFSLIELMIVVAIIGIIASIAYPSYQSTIVGSYQRTAQADLMAFAAAMERHHSGGFSYTGAGENGGNTGTPVYSQAILPPPNLKRINATTSLFYLQTP